MCERVSDREGERDGERAKGERGKGKIEKGRGKLPPRNTHPFPVPSRRQSGRANRSWPGTHSRARGGVDIARARGGGGTRRSNNFNTTLYNHIMFYRRIGQRTRGLRPARAGGLAWP